MLEVCNGAIGYGHKIILDNINLKINKGEINCVIGRNGAGKTTLFKSILRLLPLIKGDITLGQKKLKDWRQKEYARRVAYIPQAKTLPFPYRVADIVLFGRNAHLPFFGIPKKIDNELVDYVLNELSIIHLKDKIYTNLSGGEQQMVIIAKALAQEPDFLIMDEPTSNLDFGNQMRIIEHIIELKKRGIGVIMATHTPDHIFLCQSRVIALYLHDIIQTDYKDVTLNEHFFSKIYDTDVKIEKVKGMNYQRNVCFPILNPRKI